MCGTCSEDLQSFYGSRRENNEREKEKRKKELSKKDGNMRKSWRRAEQRPFVDRNLSWKILQLAKAKERQARTHFHTYNIGTPNQ